MHAQYTEIQWYYLFFREGSIKAGDRLVGVDGRDLTHCTLTEAQEVLRRVERSATLSIELVHFNNLIDCQLITLYECQCFSLQGDNQNHKKSEKYSR